MGIPDHHTCLLRNLYTSQEATVRTRHGTKDWFRTGKGVHQGCISSPWLFNLYTEYTMWNTRLDKSQAGTKTSRRNINNLRYADDTTLMAESEEELKSLLLRVKEVSEKDGLKTQHIKKTNIMASSPITSWQIDGEKVETATDFIFLGSKITAGSDCSHEIKRRLLLGKKAMTNLDSILKSRGITLLTEVCIVKTMVFSVVMYGYDSWTIKKSLYWRIDAFKFWCWRRLLRVPWTGRRSNQSILNAINPDYSLEGLMLKLKLQYFGHLMWRADSLENDSDAGKDGRQKKRVAEEEMVRYHQRLMNLSKLRGPWHAAVHGAAKSQTQPSDWTATGPDLRSL